MKNRFLCKAKTIDDKKWIIGYYSSQHIKHVSNVVKWKRVHSIVSYGKTHEQENYYEIDSKTLCQCTGLKTKDGTLVFEGDYFWHENEDGLIGIVNYDYDDVRLNVRIIPNVVGSSCVPDFNTTLEWWELEEYDAIPQIIGNIHD